VGIADLVEGKAAVVHQGAQVAVLHQ
jgi:hypothetical protein